MRRFVGFNWAYRRILAEILQDGMSANPRGMETIELLGFTFRLEKSRFNTLISESRKLSHKYLIAEWLWVLFGRNDVKTIKPFNNNIEQFSDDGERFWGAYGPQFIEQISSVIRKLDKDPNTRQAVITLWRPRPGETKDVPCTIALQFLLRDDELNMIVTMRSNDAWLGLPYDVFTFTQLQSYVAKTLGVEPGWYQHQVGSMHLYAKHIESAKKVVEEMAELQTESDDTAMALSYTPVFELPSSIEPFFITLADFLSQGKDYPFTDSPVALANGLCQGIDELRSMITVLLGHPIGRFKEIRKMENRG